jgi:hypothetical protein
VRRGRGQPEGGLAGGLGNDLLWDSKPPLK